jgi:hypothetical protein
MREAENSAKGTTKKGAIYGDRESKQFAKLLTSSGVAAALGNRSEPPGQPAARDRDTAQSLIPSQRLV